MINKKIINISRRTIFKNLFFLSFFVAVTASKTFTNTYDYLLVKKLYNLSIYNNFEQPLSDSQLKDIKELTIVKVLEDNVLLGDQITEATHIFFNDNEYYLLKENGKYVGEETVGKIKILKKCKPVNDTVEVIKNGTVIFTNILSYVNTKLKKNTPLFIIMQKNNKFYCKNLKTQELGWIYANNSYIKKIVKQKKITESSSTIPDYLTVRIKNYFKKVNGTYNSYFSFFNTYTNSNKSIPKWVLNKDSQSLNIALHVSNDIVLDDNIDVIVSDIKNILINTNLVVDYSNKNIRITVNSNDK